MGIPVYFKEITEQYQILLLKLKNMKDRLHIYFLILMD